MQDLTSSPCILMCDILPAFAVHLLSHLFQFVLLVHTQTDPLEHRFGLFRQMSGSNYFSVKQLMENEKNLKVVSLLKHTNISPLRLSVICGDELNDSPVVSSPAITDVEFCEMNFELETSELELLCFAEGYVAATQSGRSACSDCSTALISNDDLPSAEVEKSKAFFQIVEA